MLKYLSDAARVTIVTLGLTASPLFADSAGIDGEHAFKQRCSACHSLDTHRVGPRLGDVWGRSAGRVDGFNFSSALVAATFAWDREQLERWLRDPETVVPGQRMYFSIGDADARTAIIDYLEQLR